MEEKDVKSVEVIDEVMPVGDVWSQAAEQEVESSGKTTIPFEFPTITLDQIDPATGKAKNLGAKIHVSTKGWLVNARAYEFEVKYDFAEKNTALKMFFQEEPYGYTQHPLFGMKLLQLTLGFKQKTSRGYSYISHQIRNDQTELPGYFNGSKAARIRFATPENYYSKMEEVQQGRKDLEKNAVLTPAMYTGAVINQILDSRHSRKELVGIKTYKNALMVPNWFLLDETGKRREVDFTDTFNGESDTYKVPVLRNDEDMQFVGEMYTLPDGEQVRILPIDITRESLFLDTDQMRTSGVDANTGLFIRHYFRFKNYRLAAAHWFLNYANSGILYDPETEIEGSKERPADLWLAYGVINTREGARMGFRKPIFRDSSRILDGTEPCAPVIYKNGQAMPCLMTYNYAIADGTMADSHFWPVKIEVTKAAKKLPGGKTIQPGTQKSIDEGGAATVTNADFGLGGGPKAEDYTQYS